VGRVGASAGQERVSGRRTDRAGDEGVVEAHALACEPVKVGGQHLTAVGAGFLLVLVVDEKDDDVEALRRGGSGLSQQGKAARRQDNADEAHQQTRIDHHFRASFGLPLPLVSLSVRHGIL